MKNHTLRKMVTCGVLSCFALLAFMLESLFPPLILPGARMGISNVFILLSAILLGSVYGYATLVVKIVLGSIFSGNVSSIMYSLPAGLISLTFELALFLWLKRTSIIATSVCGATINVTIQNVVFCLVTQSTEYLVFLPYLSLIGIIGGLAVGFLVYLAIDKINYNFVFNKEFYKQENQSEH